MSVSLRDISEKTGFSTCTVSKALRGHPKVKEATQKAILDAAAKLGYQPNPTLARLAGGRFRTGGGNNGELIVFLQHAPGNKLSCHLSIKGAREQAERLGYRFEEHRLEDYTRDEEADRVFFARGVRGIVLGEFQNINRPLRFQWERYAAACSERTDYPLPFSRSRASFFLAVQVTLELLVEAGFRNIGVILRSEKVRREELLQISSAVYSVRSFTQLGRYVQEPLILHRDDPARLAQWFEEGQFDFILGQTVGSYWSLRENGYDLPNECPYAAIYQAMNPTDQWTRGIAGIVSQTELQGAEAVNIIDQSLRRGSLGIPVTPLEVLVPSVFLWEKSAGPLPHKLRNRVLNDKILALREPHMLEAEANA